MGLRHDLYLTRKPLAGFVAIGVSWAVYFAQMPVIKAQVGASDGAYGSALLFSALGAVSAMWLAPAFRQVCRGYAMPLAILLVAAGMFGTGLSVTLAMLTVAIFVAAVGSGVVDVLINARVSEIEEAAAVKVMSLNHALYSFAYAGAAFVTAGLRGAEVGPIPIFAGLTLVLIGLAVWSYDIPPRIEMDAGTPSAALSAPLVIVTGLVVLMAFMTEAATEGWSALHLERTLAGSPAQGALGPAILGLTMGFGRLAGHWVSQRVRETRLMLIASLVSAGGVALAGLAPTVGVALLGFAIAGLGISVVAPLALSLIGRIVPAHQRMAAISRASVIGYGAFFFGPPLMGLVSEGFGLRASFLLVAGLLGLTALALIPALARRS